MRFQLILGAIGLCLCVSGCRLASEITHNMVFETCLFADEVKGKVCYPMQARTAWKEYQGQHPECDSKDFARGFRLGYSDYLENGGDGSAHPLPPLRYWKIRHETPEGRAATESWLVGFREGAAAAKAGGQRELIVVPVGAPSAATPPPPVAPPLPAPVASPSAPPFQTPAPPASDYLPKPRTLPEVPYWKTSWNMDTPVEEEPSRRAVVRSSAEKVQPAEINESRVVLAQSREQLGQPKGTGTEQIHFKYVPEDIQRFRETATTQMRKTPRDPEPLYQVGIIAMRAGATEEGLRWLHKALVEDPHHIPSHKALMEYYQSVGDFHRAAEHRVMAETRMTVNATTEEKATR